MTTRSRLLIFAAIAFVAASALLLIQHRNDSPVSASARAEVVAPATVTADELSAAIRNSSLPVRDLNVQQVDGIFIIRGKTSDRECPARVAQLAHSLGAGRVANMVRIAGGNDDEIIRIAERRLSSSPDLGGCRFGVRAERGVLHIQGTIYADVQRETAARVVEDIDGVVRVTTDLKKL